MWWMLIEDDDSRRLIGWCFFLSQDEQNVILITYLAFEENNTSVAMMGDNDLQIYTQSRERISRFQETLAALGIQRIQPLDKTNYLYYYTHM